MSRIILPPRRELELPPALARERAEEQRIRDGLLARGWKLGRCDYCGRDDLPTLRLPNKLRNCYGCYAGELKAGEP